MEDFIRVMDENPSWLEAVRSRVLTRELIELPARFAEYAQANDARMDAFLQSLADFKEAAEREFQANREEFEIVKAHLAALDRRMGRFDRDMSILRNGYFHKIAREQGAIIADDLGCKRVKTLSPDDLMDMDRAADTSGIPVNDLRSFRIADLVMEAVRFDTGESCYIAVEISHTVNGRDTSRAIRNAGFLRRFTGKDALAVVAGARKDDRVDEDIAANGVAWHELDDEDMGTE